MRKPGRLDEAASGRGRLILISGEPGIGKTRLANELAAMARANRMSRLVGHCSDHDEAVSLLPFVEMLESLIDRASSLDIVRTTLGGKDQSWRVCCPNSGTSCPSLHNPRLATG